MEKRRNLTKKPERGSFILDHNNDCTLIKKKYLKCLKENNSDHILCRNYAKEYFICRMENNLLEKENLENLGFFENEMNVAEGSRMHGFKDVYSYNTYNEKIEQLSKEKHNPNIFSGSDININGMKKENFSDTQSYVVSKKIEVEKLPVSNKERGTFILLNISQEEQKQSAMSHVTENHKTNKTQKKIEIKRKEADGYLAGKEYVKMLAKERKKNKIHVFINSLFKKDSKKNDIH